MLKNQYLNKLTTLKIGWVIPQVLSYSKVMASTRLRVYDVIRYLKSINIKSGLYISFFRYDIVIFQKAFSKKFISLAKKLKNKNTKIIFDINVNYIDSDDLLVTLQQQKDIREMLKISDAVIVPSSFLKDLYSKYNNNVYLIEEIIEERFFKIRKEHLDKNDISLVFCGYAVKSKEIYLIKDVLKYLYEKYNVKLILISEKDPKLNIIPYKFYKYNHKIIPQLLLKGDIAISPRDISRRYNLGHSFTRIGYPMAVGLPVVASPVPSYTGSPAILCNNQEEWKNELEKLIKNYEYRKEISELGIRFVWDNFSKDKILDKYKNLFITMCL